MKITFIVLAVLVLLLGGAATAGGYMVTNSETIFPNVYVDGVAVDAWERMPQLTR